MPTSWKEQKFAVAEQNLKGVIPDAILVRVSTVGQNGEVARSAIDQFVREMLGSIPAKHQNVFIA